MNVLLSLAVVAIAGTATTALADNSFSFVRLQPTTASVHFGFVNSDGIGVVEIYDYDGHVAGKLLGSQAVAPGSNPGLEVQMNPMQFNDVIAVLMINGVKMADQVVEFRRQGH